VTGQYEIILLAGIFLRSVRLHFKKRSKKLNNFLILPQILRIRALNRCKHNNLNLNLKVKIMAILEKSSFKNTTMKPGMFYNKKK
jgi:hypothetical protein